MSEEEMRRFRGAFSDDDGAGPAAALIKDPDEFAKAVSANQEVVGVFGGFGLHERTSIANVVFAASSSDDAYRLLYLYESLVRYRTSDEKMAIIFSPESMAELRNYHPAVNFGDYQAPDGRVYSRRTDRTAAEFHLLLNWIGSVCSGGRFEIGDRFHNRLDSQRLAFLIALHSSPSEDDRDRIPFFIKTPATVGILVNKRQYQKLTLVGFPLLHVYIDPAELDTGKPHDIERLRSEHKRMVENNVCLSFQSFVDGDGNRVVQDYQFYLNK